MSGHTPGPWEVLRSGGQMAVTTGKHRAAVAFVPPHHLDAEANAHLIAAAPDLLVALKDCLAHMSGGEKSCGHPFECVCVGKNAAAAIARAEGKP